MSKLYFDLRRAMDEYEAKTGIHLTYEALALATGISANTLKSIASRPNYNVTFNLITQISTFLNIDPRDFLTWETE